MMADEYERRAFDQPVRFRAAPEGSASPGTLDGYAVVFNQLSRDLGGWFEIIDPSTGGEPTESGQYDVAANGRVIARTNHDSNLLIGTTDAGTLRLFVDDVGFRYEVDLPNTNAGRDAAVLAERGDFCYSSFAFMLLPDGCAWEYGPQDQLVCRVTAFKLVDVAPVADPAYWGSSVGLRNFDLDAIKAELRSDTPTEPENVPNTRALARARDIQIQLTMKGGR
jgi:uncharacterized protein